MMKLLKIGLILITLAYMYPTVVQAIDFLEGTVFLSEVGGGNITFAEDISADNVTWTADRVLFGNFTYDTFWWNYTFGVRAPVGCFTLNITDVNATYIVMDITQNAGIEVYEFYMPNVGQPVSVTGAATDNYVSPTQYFTMNGNGTVIISWAGGTFTINVYALYDEVEEDMYALLYATCVNGTGDQHGADVTFTVDGVAFTWNTYTDRYEGTVRKMVPVTVTFDSLGAFVDTGDATATGTINRTATVTWTFSAQQTILAYMQVGDYGGAIIAMFTETIGGLVFNTFIMVALSLAIYNYTGPEATLLAWILGWGLFSSVVHGTALMVGLIMLSLGGGLILVKIFLDRRAT